MTDRAKVIRVLEESVPFLERIGYSGIGHAVHDALELLKLQEPKTVKIIKNAYNQEFYYCPNCDRGFVDTYYKRPLFCDKCGQAVKWE